jgi:hypothetical protein
MALAHDLNVRFGTHGLDIIAHMLEIIADRVEYDEPLDRKRLAQSIKGAAELLWSKEE